MNQVITILGQDENGETIRVEVLDEADHFNGILMQTEEEHTSGKVGSGTTADEEGGEEEEVDSSFVSQVLDANLLGSSDDIHIEMSTPDGGIHTISLPSSASEASIVDYGAMDAAAEQQQQQHQKQQQQQVQQKSRILTPEAVVEATKRGNQEVTQRQKKRKASRHQISLLSPASKRSAFLPHHPPQQQPNLPLPSAFKASAASPDEFSVSLSFVDWLSSVTERVNQCMHLVFHAPHAFFDCLRERMALGGEGSGLRAEGLPPEGDLHQVHVEAGQRPPGQADLRHPEGNAGAVQAVRADQGRLRAGDDGGEAGGGGGGQGHAADEGRRWQQAQAETPGEA